MDHALSRADEPRAGSIGTLVGIDSPTLTEMISTLGFDFLFLDLEHGAVTEASLAHHVMASRVPVLARLAEQAQVMVKKAADAGAHVLVIPHIGSRAAAEDVVRWAKYPPVGERSVGLSRNALLGVGLADALKATDKPGIIAQIEDSDGVRNVDAICRVPGIDGVFIGPYDLSAALGDPGNFATAAFRQAVAGTVAAARAAGVTVGAFAPSVAVWADFQQQGCDYVVLSSDSLLLAENARRKLEDARKL